MHYYTVQHCLKQKSGSHLAKILLAEHQSVVVIEERQVLLDKLAHELPPEAIVAGDGSSPAALERADIQKANVLAAVTGSDETNLVITSLARFEFGVPRIIARVNNLRSTCRDLFRQLEIDLHGQINQTPDELWLYHNRHEQILHPH